MTFLTTFKQAFAWFLVGRMTAFTRAENSTFYNPVLSGWHSDPSCVQVDGTFYCVFSTFVSFPGLPIYASKDLMNWKLISHAWNRESQLPNASARTNGQQEGFYAATIRHHEGEFWVVCEYLGLPEGMLGTIFKSPDPYDEGSWDDPITFITSTGDLDLFWDDDGKLYVPAQGAVLQEVDLDKGEVTNRINIWSGTGGVWPEGPHLYRKDGYYYISLAEGGTELGHYQVMARSINLTGPYTPCPYNPVLTNANTTEYFQTVGHADLFQDLEGNWWGVALATRSGPDWEVYPMGRETVLFPVTWDEGDWPVLQPVRGKMSGWALPPTNRDLLGDGPFNSDPDIYNFLPGSSIPRNLIYWRVPLKGAFSIAASGGLEIVPSRSNLTGNQADLDGRTGLSFIGRRQTDSLFKFEVDIETNPIQPGQEAGVTVFLTQKNHIDLAVVSRSSANNGSLERILKFSTEGGDGLAENVLIVPEEWGLGPIRFELAASNVTHYTLTAFSTLLSDDKRVMGIAPATIVSGRSGPFTGALVGVFASCNGAGSGHSCPDGGQVLVRNWSYIGQGQYYTETELIPNSQ